MSDQTANASVRDIARSAGRFAQRFLAFGRRRIWWAAGLVALAGALESTGIVLLIPILNVMTSMRGSGKFQAFLVAALNAVGAHTASAGLAVLLCIFAGLTLAHATVLYAQNMLLSDLQSEFVESVRNGIMRRLAATPWSRIVSLRHVRIVHLMSVETQRMGASAELIIRGSVAVLTLLILGTLALALAPKLVAATMLAVVAGGALLALTLRRTRNVGAEIGRAGIVLMRMTTDFLGGLKAAVAQNVQGGFVDEFETVHKQLRLRQRELTYSRTFNRLAIITVPALTGVAAIWLGVEDFAIRPAVLITVILIFARMTRPLVRLRQSAQQFVLSLPAFEAVEALQAELDADARPLPKATRPLPPGPIVLHDVSYRHQGGGGVFKAGLVLEPGTFLGVTGPSGGGKTTFGDLLAGILEPQAGQITVGGECLDETHLAAWRNVIAYVDQDPFLFHDTVRRNLTWGERSADDAQLWRTLDCAGAAVLVKGFEHGLDTIIGERGARLSGGECQRIAIARALLRPARLLVLDEATNALDVDGEAEILRRLAALHPRPTIVLIAHRTESLAYCDRIVAIIRGRPLSLETADSMTSKSSAPEGAEIWRNAV